MDVTDHIVNITVIYDNLGDTRLNKTAFQFIQRSCEINRHHLSTGNNTIAYFNIREVKCVLEDFHFRIQFLLILGIINAALHKIIKIHLSESFVGRILVYLHAENAQEDARQTGRQLGYRI